MNYIAVDLETKGLIKKGLVPEIVCVSFAGDYGSECLEWCESTRGIVQNLASNNTFVYHNSSFDHAILTAYGLDIPRYHDTKLMSYILEPSAFHNHALAHWGEVLGYPKLPKPWEGDYPTEYSEELAGYCKVDSKLTLKLFYHLEALLKADAQAWEFYSTVELPYTAVIMEMEATGMYVDTKTLQELDATLNARLRELEQETTKLCPLGPGAVKKYKKQHPDKVLPEWEPLGQEGDEWHYKQYVPFNPASNVHKAYALMKEGWIPKEMTPDGSPKVSKDILEAIPDSPLADLLVEHAGVNKIVSSYTTPFFNFTDDQRVIRGNFNQTVTKTGRLSSSEPNLQNIPTRGDLGKQMRNLVTTPGEDIVLFNGDLSNMEARILAWMMYYFMEDRAMADTFIAGEDFHSANAAAWGVDRLVAKTLFFAILYGAGVAKIAKSLKRPFMEAKRLVEKLHTAMPAIQQLKDAFWETARQSDGIIHTMMGRRLVYVDITSKDGGKRSAAERQIFNAYIQGSQADILKALTLQSMPVLREYDAVLSASVHDELLGYVDVGNAPALCADLTHIFSSSEFILPIPVVADFKFGYHWGILH